MFKTETTTEIASMAEPGSAVAVPDAIVADVAQTIREMHRTAGLQFAYDVGQLILTKFYGGDVAAFRSHAAKDSSLRRLAEQPDMPLGRSALHQAVEVHLLVERRGGVQTLGRLGPSHVRTVLALPALDQDKLLAKAEAKALTVKQLEAEARKAKIHAGKGKGGGRPALPAFVKSIHALGKYVEGDFFGGLEAVDELEVDEAQELFATVAGLKARCEELMGRLGGRVVERTAAAVEALPEAVPPAVKARDRSSTGAQVAEQAAPLAESTTGPLKARKGGPRAAAGIISGEPVRAPHKGRSDREKAVPSVGTEGKPSAASETADARDDGASAVVDPAEPTTKVKTRRRRAGKAPTK